jgi:hypothetical protein
MADNKVEVIISAKSDDKGLNQFIQSMDKAQTELKQTAQTAEQSSGSFSGLGGAVTKLVGILGGLAILSKVTGWLKEGVMGAIEEERALNALTVMVRQFDPSMQNLSVTLEEYVSQMKNVGMADEEVYNGVRQLIPITKDYENATKGVSLAWDLSVATGWSYQQSLDLIAGLIANNPRSLKAAQRDLGIEAATCQEALDKLYGQFDGYSGKINDHLTELNKMEKWWADFKEWFGGTILNAFDFWSTEIPKKMRSMAIGILEALNSITPAGSEMEATLLGLINAAKKVDAEMSGLTGVASAGKGAPTARQGGAVTAGATGSRATVTEAADSARAIAEAEAEVVKDSKDWETNYKLKSDQKYFKTSINYAKEAAKAKKELSEQELERERDLNQKKIDAQFALAGMTSQLLRTAFGQNKAAASAAAMIDAFAAAAKNNAAYPQPYGGIMAALALAIGMAQVAQIQSQKYSAAMGFDIPAGLNPMTQLHEQEMVLPKEEANIIRALAAKPSTSISNRYGDSSQVIQVNALTGAYGIRQASKKLKQGERLYKAMRVR